VSEIPIKHAELVMFPHDPHSYLYVWVDNPEDEVDFVFRTDEINVSPEDVVETPSNFIIEVENVKCETHYHIRPKPS